MDLQSDQLLWLNLLSFLKNARGILKKYQFLWCNAAYLLKYFRRSRLKSAEKQECHAVFYVSEKHWNVIQLFILSAMGTA